MTGQINKNYISSIDMLDQRELLNQLLDITNEDFSLVEIMELTNRMVATSHHTYHAFTNRELFTIETVKTGSTPTDNSGGSGQGDVTFAVTAANGSSTLRAGDLVMLPSKHNVYVYSVTSDAGGDLVRVKAMVPSVTTANLSISADDKLSVYGRAEGEASGAPKPIKFGVDKVSNHVQIIKESYQITDVEKANKIEFDFNGQPYYMLKAQHDAFRKFQAYISYILIYNQVSEANFGASNPSLTDSAGNPVQTTRGLNQYIDNDGITRTGSLDLALYANLSRDFAAARAPKEYNVYMGIEHQIDHDDLLSNLNGAFSTNARLMVDGKTLDLGIKKWNLYGREYNMIYMPMIDHRNIINFEGSAGYQNDAFYVPTGKMKTQDGNMQDRIRVRYLDNLHGGATYKETQHGRLAPIPNGEEDYFKAIYSCALGLEVLGANFFAKVTRE